MGIDDWRGVAKIAAEMHSSGDAALSVSSPLSSALESLRAAAETYTWWSRVPLNRGRGWMLQR
jgi:hypothetical protein